MFQAERWAAAFAAVSGDGLGEGLEVLRVIACCTVALRGPVVGMSAAFRLERMIRTALEKTGTGSRSAEFAARFVSLMVKKGRFFALNQIIKEVEKISDEREGVMVVIIEAVTAPDRKFEEELKRKLIKQSGAREIRLIFRAVPGLLGGCRLRIGSEVIDASLRGQIQKMAADLGAAALPVQC
jgi:F-type H+-transporting ATPase subunit delta